MSENLLEKEMSLNESSTFEDESSIDDLFNSNKNISSFNENNYSTIELSTIKNSSFQSDEMKRFMAHILPEDNSNYIDIQYDNSIFFPQWLLDNQTWNSALRREKDDKDDKELKKRKKNSILNNPNQSSSNNDKENSSNTTQSIKNIDEVIRIFRLLPSQRKVDQWNQLVDWLMSTWNHAETLGPKKCLELLKIIKYQHFSPGEVVFNNRKHTQGVSFQTNDVEMKSNNINDSEDEDEYEFENSSQVSTPNTNNNNEDLIGESSKYYEDAAPMKSSFQSNSKSKKKQYNLSFNLSDDTFNNESYEDEETKARKLLEEMEIINKNYNNDYYYFFLNGQIITNLKNLNFITFLTDKLNENNIIHSKLKSKHFNKNQFLSAYSTYYPKQALNTMKILVKALKPSDCLIITRNDFNHFLSNLYDIESNENFFTLKQSSLFNNQIKNKERIKTLANLCKRCKYLPNVTIKKFQLKPIPPITPHVPIHSPTKESQSSFNFQNTPMNPNHGSGGTGMGLNNGVNLTGYNSFQYQILTDSFFIVLDGNVKIYEENISIKKNRWPVGKNKWSERVCRSINPIPILTLKKGDIFGNEVYMKKISENLLKKSLGLSTNLKNKKDYTNLNDIKNYSEDLNSNPNNTTSLNKNNVKKYINDFYHDNNLTLIAITTSKTSLLFINKIYYYNTLKYNTNADKKFDNDKLLNFNHVEDVYSKTISDMQSNSFFDDDEEEVEINYNHSYNSNNFFHHQQQQISPTSTPMANSNRNKEKEREKSQDKHQEKDRVFFNNSNKRYSIKEDKLINKKDKEKFNKENDSNLNSKTSNFLLPSSSFTFSKKKKNKNLALSPNVNSTNSPLILSNSNDKFQSISPSHLIPPTINTSFSLPLLNTNPHSNSPLKTTQEVYPKFDLNSSINSAINSKGSSNFSPKKSNKLPHIPPPSTNNVLQDNDNILLLRENSVINLGKTYQHFLNHVEKNLKDNKLRTDNEKDREDSRGRSREKDREIEHHSRRGTPLPLSRSSSLIPSANIQEITQLIQKHHHTLLSPNPNSNSNF